MQDVEKVLMPRQEHSGMKQTGEIANLRRRQGPQVALLGLKRLLR